MKNKIQNYFNKKTSIALVAFLLIAVAIIAAKSPNHSDAQDWMSMDQDTCAANGGVWDPAKGPEAPCFPPDGGGTPPPPPEGSNPPPGGDPVADCNNGGGTWNGNFCDFNQQQGTTDPNQQPVQDPNQQCPQDKPIKCSDGRCENTQLDCDNNTNQGSTTTNTGSTTTTDPNAGSTTTTQTIKVEGSDVPCKGGSGVKVCGANGVTYASECAAHEAFVPIVHDGECKLPGQEPTNTFNAAPAECNAPKLRCADGRCVDFPEMCRFDYDPNKFPQPGTTQPLSTDLFKGDLFNDGNVQCPNDRPIKCSTGQCARTQLECDQGAQHDTQCPATTPIRCHDNSCAKAAAECPGFDPNKTFDDGVKRDDGVEKFDPNKLGPNPQFDPAGNPLDQNPFFFDPTKDPRFGFFGEEQNFEFHDNDFAFKTDDFFKQEARFNSGCSPEAVQAVGPGCHPVGGALFDAGNAHYVFFGDYKNKHKCETEPIDGCNNFSFNKIAAEQWHQGPQCDISQKDNASYRVDPYCYGSNHSEWEQWGGQSGCEAAGYVWDQFAYGQFGQGDCFPGQVSFAGNFPGNDFGFDPLGNNNRPQTNKFDAYLEQYKEIQGESGQKVDYCNTSFGRNDAQCRIFASDKDSFKALDFDFNESDFEAGNVSRRDEVDIERMKDEVERVTLNIGGQYCPGVEKAQGLIVQLEDNPGLIRKIGPNMSKIFDALHQCESKIHTTQELGDLVGRVNELCDSDGKDQLLEKIEEISADTSKIFASARPGRGPFDDFWKKADDLDRQCYKQRSNANVCASIAEDAQHIKMWLDGDDRGDGPERNDENEGLANKALALIKNALGKAKEDPSNAKNYCRRAEKELCIIEAEAGVENDGEGFCQEEENTKDLLARQLGFDENKKREIAEAYEGISGDIDIEALIQKEVEKRVALFQEKIQKKFDNAIAKFMDTADKLLNNALMTKLSDEVATLTDTFEGFDKRDADELNEKVTGKLNERVQYYSEEDLEKIGEEHEKIVSAINPIMKNLPKEVIKDLPKINEVLEKGLTEIIPEATTDEIVNAARVAKNIVEASIEIDEDGKPAVKANREEKLKEGLQEFFNTVEKQLDPKALDEKAKAEGLKPDVKDLTDLRGQWFEEPALAATSKGLFKGTGEGKLDPGAKFSAPAVATTVARMAGLKEKPEAAEGVNAPDWAKGTIGALIDKGALTKEEANRDFNFTGDAKREDVAALVVKGMEAADPDFKNIDFGACVLDEATPDVGCDHPRAKELDKAYKMGLMTGQGDGSLDPQGGFNRAQGFKVMSLADQFLDELKASGPAVIGEKVNPNANKAAGTRGAAPASAVGNDIQAVGNDIQAVGNDIQ